MRERGSADQTKKKWRAKIVTLVGILWGKWVPKDYTMLKKAK